MASNILTSLNPEQKKAVTTTEGPLLIIAGAGTGKTSVITRRIAYILEKKLAKPSEILALTFTDKAAAEMEERIDILVPYGFIDTWIYTFHAFGDRILRENAFDIGLPPDFKVLSRPQQVLFFQQNLFRLDLEYYRPLSNPTKFISAMLSFFSRLKDENISPEKLNKFALGLKKETKDEGTKIEAQRYTELSRAFEMYEKLKNEAGVLDFGDQVVKTIDLFTRRPKILKKYQEQFKYILVDEYQDTNFAQNEMVKMLGSTRQNMCVVGDDDQCLPPSTLISTPDGPKKIEILKENDQVITAVGKGHLGISGITKVFKNSKTARFITIKTKNGRKITLTDNHKVFCYIPSRVIKRNYYYVYLMHRQNLGWRIGITNDLATRLRLERSADRIIGLKAFKTASEARYFEILWSLKYGIPSGVFKERIKTIIKGDLLQKFYKDLDSEGGALKLAEDLNISLNSAHCMLGAVTRGSSERIKINLELCTRNYRSKSIGILQKPLIAHTLNLQTSNQTVINTLKEGGFKLKNAKKGLRLRMQSGDLLSLGKIAEKLAHLTKGLIEPKFSVGFASVQSKPAIIMPASNLLAGHYLPIIKGNKVYYDEIIDIKEFEKTETVYDLEIEKTHNFIANGIVVHNSIYKFRGAAISNILEFKKWYPKTNQVVLTENYRSTQTILNAGYRLITNNNPDRLEVQNKIVKKLKSQNGQGSSPQEIYTNTISEEADAVAAEIDYIMKKKPAHRSLGEGGSYTYKDFAILVRANAAADHYLRALNMKGIPHKFVGSSGLYQQEEVALLISFLNAISDVEDSLNLYFLITSDLYQVPPLDAIKLTSYAKRKNRSLFHILQNIKQIDKYDLPITEEGKAIIEKVILDLEEAIQLSRKYNVGKVLYEYLKKTNYLARLEREGTAEAQTKVQNIAKFFDKITEFSKIASPASPEGSPFGGRAKVESVIQFVEYLESLRQAGDDPATVDFDPELDAVNVMTVHGAKGLEFPVVFMVNLVSDRFPIRFRPEAIEIPETLIQETLPSGDWHVQEERRLFYVGITRAKQLLYFTWSRDVGLSRLKKISPFVQEALGKVNSQSAPLIVSPKEKIEKFAPPAPRTTQTLLFDTDVLKLTQGAIDDYLTCAYKYRFAHVLHLPILRHHAMVYGAAIHGAVAQFLNSKKRGSPLALDQVLEIFERAWDSEGFLSEDHELKRKNQGKLTLESFMKRELDSQDLPGLIEAKFDFSMKDINIFGRFDRVDIQPGTKVTIIDYKTSENMTQERADMQTKESIQLGIYALYYWKRHKVLPETVKLHFLENGIEGVFHPTQKDLEKVENLILETADNIRRDMRNNSFVAKPKYFGQEPACNYCAFSSICSFSLAK